MRQSFFALAALSLWQSCTAQAVIETLVPYHPRSFDISKRNAPPTVTLQDELSLVWGSANGSTFVNVTLNTGETELVISTEHFAESLTDVQCQGDLVLTFKDNATFQDAIADWSWVNFHENRTFFMINNWGACAAAAESGRQPWIVHGVDAYDQQSFIVNFNATLVEWDDVMSDAVIEFGSISPTSAKRDDTVSKTLSLSLAHSLPQTFFSKSTNSGLDFSIDCPGCATTGSIEVQGKIVMGTNFIGIPTSVKSVSINATPKGVGANLALGFGVSGTLGSGWSKEWNLITVGLPGWSIPKIITLGPQFTVDAGFTLSSIEGSAQISAGINVAIPDSSSAVLGISGVGSSFKGWVPTVTPQTPKVSVEVDGHLELYTELGLDVGLTVLSKYGFGGGLFLRIPDVNIDLGAEFNTQGVCPGSADVFGVKLGTTVGVNLGLGVYTESSGNKNWKGNTTIYENDNLITPIDKCFPLGPTLPATIKSVSIKTVGTVPASTKVASTKPTTRHASSSKASTTPTSATDKTSGSASATAHSTSKISGTGVSSSIKVSGAGVSSSKVAVTGSYGYSTGVSSSKAEHTGVSSSSLHGYGTAPVSSSTTKLSGTGVSSSSKVTGTGISPYASYGTHPDTTASSIKEASTSTHLAEGYGGYSSSVSKSPGTAVISSSLYVSASGVSSVKTATPSSSTSSVVGLETSKSSFSSVNPTTTAGGPLYRSSTSSALGLETSKASSYSGASSTKASFSASSTALPTKSATGTIAPAPTATGTISTCDKWVTIEDTNCSCQNIENFYGVAAANLILWNPALGSECSFIEKLRKNAEMG
ncbi:hypothetical protein EYC84_010549 [Monilinia fructicola]|uniref:LysM domain-containing protein n=1 Tax=Monilinia fructicola TaxID=38448 RepID=A0A5M9J7H3_MONFR|nr:hypothetical protein EYC84_010549 [Monilinia fructicola]